MKTHGQLVFNTGRPDGHVFCSADSQYHGIDALNNVSGDLLSRFVHQEMAKVYAVDLFL